MKYKSKARHGMAWHGVNVKTNTTVVRGNNTWQNTWQTWGLQYTRI